MSEQSIKEQVMDIWDIGSKDGYEKAVSKLRKMYLKYGNKDISTEEYRLIVYNLMLYEMDLNNGKCTDNTKIYSKDLKEKMESTGYMNTCLDYKKKYCRVLNSYRDSHIYELTKKEIKWINKYIYEVFKDYEYDEDNILDYSDMMISKFNIALEMNNYISLIKILNELKLHTNNEDISMIYKQLLGVLNDCDIRLAL